MKQKIFTITCCLALLLVSSNIRAQAPDTSTVDNTQVPTNIF